MYRLNYEQFDRDNQYIGNDLGAVMKEGKTVFKTWSPLATGVYLNLYLDGEGKSRLESLPMERLDHGVWYVEILRDLDGVFYTYTFEFDHKTRHETIDIYAKACGVNGNVGAVVNFKTTDPEGWDKVKKPKCRNACDAVVYECHVRDFSADSSSGVASEHRGKYVAFADKGTKYEGRYDFTSGMAVGSITHAKALFTDVCEDLQKAAKRIFECSSPVCRTKLESLQILYLRGFASFCFTIKTASEQPLTTARKLMLYISYIAYPCTIFLLAHDPIPHSPVNKTQNPACRH